MSSEHFDAVIIGSGFGCVRTPCGPKANASAVTVPVKTNCLVLMALRMVTTVCFSALRTRRRALVPERRYPAAIRTPASFLRSAAAAPVLAHRHK